MQLSPLRALVLAVVLVGLTALALVLALSARPGGSAPPTGPLAEAAADPAHTAPSSLRTLVVSTSSEPSPSEHPDRMRALLIEGALPSRPMTAIVLSDEDCAPDEAGVSHCRNELALPSGRTIAVRHPHKMHEVPCMTPGEVVRLARAADA